MTKPASSWLRMARGLRRKMNFAYWLDRIALPVVIASAIAASAVLVTRYQWPNSTHPWPLVPALALPTIAMCWIWFLARKEFIGIEEALIRIEVRYSLNAALSTAMAGAGDWPPYPNVVNDGLRWRWLRAGLPPALAVALVAVSWFLPISIKTHVVKVSQPASWTVVEDDLKTLVEQRLVDEPSTLPTQKAIEALKARPQGEWFDHSSIEASDRILQAHQQDMSALEGRLRDTARELRQAATPRPGIQPGKSGASAALDKAITGLRMGSLVPDQDLLDKLSKLTDENGEGLNQISPQQMAELLDQLDQNAKALSDMQDQLGNGIADDGAQGDKLADGKGENGNGADGKGDNGKGGPSRGPGEGGSLFGDKQNDQQAKNSVPLPSGDLSRTTPGDWIGERQSTHDIDPKNSPALQAGGAPTQKGDGGSAVWKDNLHPDEQEALRRFFE